MTSLSILRFTLLLPLAFQQAPAQSPRALPLAGDVAGTHDPSIIRAGKTWYVFATGKAPGGGQFAVRCSDDLEHWTLCGHVFDEIPAWIHERSPGTRELWAPDISVVNGEYRLYYSYSLFGRNTSGIALATTRRSIGPAPTTSGSIRALFSSLSDPITSTPSTPTSQSTRRATPGSLSAASGMASKCAASMM